MIAIDITITALLFKERDVFFRISICLCLFVSSAAFASLGDDQSMVESDRAAFHASRRASKTSEKYTVHEIGTGSLTIREYADASGKIFGIYWKGLAQPDLSALLGKYLSDYQGANRRGVRQLGRRSYSKLSGDQMVIERFGHMRAVRGRVYLPALLPDGVTSNEIQ